MGSKGRALSGVQEQSPWPFSLLLQRFSNSLRDSTQTPDRALFSPKHGRLPSGRPPPEDAMPLSHIAAAMSLAATLVAATAAAAPCARDGDQITATGRLGIGHVTPPADPSHRTQSYLFIAFDPGVCVVEPDAPAGEPVTRAEFLTERPPLKSMMGAQNTYTGSIERGSDATGETFSFVAY